MSFVNIPVARHAHNFSGDGISDGKGKHPAFGLALQPSINLGFHLGWFRDNRVPQLPQLAVLYGFGKIAVVRLRQRFQDCMRSAQSDGLRPGHIHSSSQQ
jgi:hypothetical protein